MQLERTKNIERETRTERYKCALEIYVMNKYCVFSSTLYCLGKLPSRMIFDRCVFCYSFSVSFCCKKSSLCSWRFHGVFQVFILFASVFACVHVLAHCASIDVCMYRTAKCIYANKFCSVFSKRYWCVSSWLFILDVFFILSWMFKVIFFLFEKKFHW